MLDAFPMSARHLKRPRVGSRSKLEPSLLWAISTAGHSSTELGNPSSGQQDSDIGQGAGTLGKFINGQSRICASGRWQGGTGASGNELDAIPTVTWLPQPVDC